MSNKHSLGPKCPLCQSLFRDANDLRNHQIAKRHFPDRPTEEALEEKRARAKMAAYDRERRA